MDNAKKVYNGLIFVAAGPPGGFERCAASGVAVEGAAVGGLAVLLLLLEEARAIKAALLLLLLILGRLTMRRTGALAKRFVTPRSCVGRLRRTRRVKTQRVAAREKVCRPCVPCPCFLGPGWSPAFCYPPRLLERSPFWLAL